MSDKKQHIATIDGNEATAYTAYRVLTPRPVPVWADDPFGTPNTLQADPCGRRMTVDEYELREAAYEATTEVAAR